MTLSNTCLTRTVLLRNASWFGIGIVFTIMTQFKFDLFIERFNFFKARARPTGFLNMVLKLGISRVRSLIRGQVRLLGAFSEIARDHHQFTFKVSLFTETKRICLFVALATSGLLTIPASMPPALRGRSLITIEILLSFDTAALNIARHDLLELFFGHFMCIRDKIFIPITTKNPFFQIRSRGILLFLIHLSCLRFRLVSA
jgi:hypothetical protein